MLLLFLHLQLLPWQLLAREKHYFNCFFSFCGESGQPFVTGHIYRAVSGIGNSRFRITDLLNSQLQRVDLGSTCA